MKKSITFIILTVVPFFAFCQSGTLDPQFFDNGEFVFFDEPDVSPNTYVNDMFRDSNGDFLVCGQSLNAESINIGFIVKFSADGQLIESFGNGGIAYFDENSSVQGVISSIEQLNNGNYVVLSAPTSSSPTFTTLTLSEIGQNGEVIEGFGNGNATYTLSGSTFVERIEISPQGKIWVHFNRVNLPNTFNNSSNIYALQFNQDGSLNEFFGTDGLFEYGEDEFDERVFGLAFDDNENAYLCGSYRAGTNSSVLSEVQILGIEPTGQFKTDFAQGGIFRFNDNMASYGGQNISFHNNELLFCGFRYDFKNGENGIIGKINIQGSLISSFGEAGFVLFDQADSSFPSMAIDNVGNILAFGQLENSNTNEYDIFIANYDENGAPIASFGNNGVTKLWDLNNGDDKPISIVLTDDGQGILAAGNGFYLSFGGGGDELPIGNYGFVLKYGYDQPTSVIENSTMSVQIFPNPARDVINIVSESNIDVLRIYDISGRMVEASNFYFQNNILDISHLSGGTYVLQLGNTVFKKFVVCSE